MAEAEPPSTEPRADVPPGEFTLLEGDDDASVFQVRGAWDPLALVAVEARFASPVLPAPPSAPALPPEPLVAAEVVRAIAWGGDRRRGTARLELGGRLTGAAVRIDAHDGQLSIEVDAPAGSDAADLVDRVSKRLGARGFSVDSVIVR